MSSGQPSLDGSSVKMAPSLHSFSSLIDKISPERSPEHKGVSQLANLSIMFCFHLNYV